MQKKFTCPSCKKSSTKILYCSQRTVYANYNLAQRKFTSKLVMSHNEIPEKFSCTHCQYILKIEDYDQVQFDKINRPNFNTK